jgi:hypothetical protein
MGLTYRSDLNRPLTNTEIDNNFRYFTGSQAITGSVITSGSSTVIGNVAITNGINITGSFISSGSSFIINNVSGSVLTPTASLTGLIAPTFNGVDGQFLFGSGSEGYKLFVWIGGAWRSGSLS